MGAPEPLHVSDALDKLVNQFSDPLSFFRELIQNALDAGSQEVEVRCEFTPDAPAAEERDDDAGTLVLHVEDWGEGMNREIIEKKLTRLFSSAKDGDRTKIGKFGIGFVSVFAIDPQAVCVDTSREGEHWRVIFNEQRRFSLIKLEAPVDGTKIKIFKSMTRRAFADFRARARGVIEFWCKHVPGEIRYDDEVITWPLGIDALCKFHVTPPGDGTELVVAHAEGDEGFSGYYNRGLTLMEGDGAPFRGGIAFKASSPNIEHTLTRDDVIRDARFFRVEGLVQETVRGPLCARVFELLEEHVVHGAHETSSGYLYKAASWHLADGHALPEGVLARAVAQTPGGVPITLATLQQAFKKREILVCRARSPLTDALEADEGGHLLVLLPAAAPSEAEAGSGATTAAATQRADDEGEEVADERAPDDDIPAAPVERLLAAVSEQTGKRARELKARYCMPLPPSDALEDARWRPLQQAVRALMDDLGAKLSEVALAHFSYPESAIAARVAITQRELGAVSELAQARLVGTSFFSRRRALVINADHEMVGTLVELARSEPEFAAYQLVKLFFLGERLDTAFDSQLAQHTMERRWQRSNS